MCGIGGFTWADPELLSAFVRSIRHRGPDDEGQWTNDAVSLCHTRLSIIDLTTAGAQPMTSADAKVVLSYNGEIYNFRELRAQLLALGHQFRGESDTEVLLQGYVRWGLDVFARCNGMWAAAVYDQDSGYIHLVRDRLGQKPLYYGRFDQGWAFCSELSAIAALQPSNVVSPQAIDLLLSSQFIPSPWSIYEGIYKVRPGQIVSLHQGGRALETSAYYTPPRYTPVDSRQLVQEGRALLRDAVRARTVSDVTLGGFLSGGLDSTAIVGYLREYVPKNLLRTCSVGFDLPGLDETHYAELASSAYGTQHTTERFSTVETEGYLARVSKAYDEPLADPSSLPTFLLCKSARTQMTVALSGDGGDELFGGYASRQMACRFVSLCRFPRFIRRLGHAVLRLFPTSGGRLSKIKEALRVSLLAPERFFSEIGAKLIHRPPAWKQWAESSLRAMLQHAEGNLVEAVLKFDIHHNRLGDNYCAKVDRMSMHHGLEVRSPFLDYRLVEFSSRIPVERKLDKKRTKILLRDIVSDVVPEAILHREKHGFAAPVGVWADEHVEKLRVVVEVLSKRRLLSRKWEEFYRTNVLAEDTADSREFRKRLAMLWWWLKEHDNEIRSDVESAQAP